MTSDHEKFDTADCIEVQVGGVKGAFQAARALFETVTIDETVDLSQAVLVSLFSADA